MKKIFLLRVLGKADGGVIDQTVGEKQEVQEWLQGNIASGKYGDQALWETQESDVSAQALLSLKRARQKAKRSFCLDLIDQIGLLNDGASTSDMMGILSNAQLHPIFFGLLLGTPETLISAFQSAGPGMYGQEKTDALVSSIQEFLTALGPEPVIEDDSPVDDQSPESEEEPPAENSPQEGAGEQP